MCARASGKSENAPSARRDGAPISILPHMTSDSDQLCVDSIRALSMDEIKQFRQWGSLTPGHPERDRVHVTPGVEVTTGPLGAGFANGVGMAIAERFLREHFGEEVQNHHIYAIVSDGDLMEGIASEAASLAGQLGLGRLLYFYDDNDISLDGPTSLSFTTEDRAKRFEA